ncbi:hypothetical protein EJ04DRAFT_558569 [Polyplosphaeria fusca]|uniref:Uncharacterized protein n=1 Tax=Polyplosphaeria fusca TaxID=682080 RepID=A0A9P4RC50_9PLEO|nr:hypothetical protein EJ04DRAFT_558569 [Polyplosphaeria fusca]
MIFRSAFLLSLTALVATTSAAPAGSKHNIYLTRCTPTSCPIGACDPGDFGITAAAYYSTATSAVPASIGTIDGYQPKWEGASKAIRLGTTTFTSAIQAAAARAKKGDIVGDAKLGSEPFVCFKDGATTLGFTYDDTKYSCTADYWCGSVDVGK